jgi:hypothetical protein
MRRQGVVAILTVGRRPRIREDGCRVGPIQEGIKSDA